MKQLCAYLLVFFIVATLGCKTSQSNNGPNDDLPITPLESTIVGGSSIMTEEEMKNEIFTEAVDAVIEMLNDKNDCIDFKLSRIRDATKQVVAGMKYRLSLIVQPVLVNPEDADCQSSCITEAIRGEQVVQAVVVTQVWKKDKHHIELVASPGIASKFGSDGEMFLNCVPDLPPTLLYRWTKMTKDELVSPQFMMVVNKAIEELNKSAAKCFSHRLDYVKEGRTTGEPNRKYEWMMKIHRIYQDDLPGCRGMCADECTGIDTYKFNAEITAQNDVTVTLKMAN